VAAGVVRWRGAVGELGPFEARRKRHTVKRKKPKYCVMVIVLVIVKGFEERRMSIALA